MMRILHIYPILSDHLIQVPPNIIMEIQMETIFEMYKDSKTIKIKIGILSFASYDLLNDGKRIQPLWLHPHP